MLMHDAMDAHVVDLAHDEYADVSMREEPLAVPTPDFVVDEVDVHVVLPEDGHWHREMTHKVTACGRKIALTGLWRRPKKYDASDAPYCTKCFSERELLEANAVRTATAEVERELDDEWRAQDWQSRRRLNTAGDAQEKARRISERIDQKLLLGDPEKKDDTK